jgi:uncharacterized protein (DUF58 family)
VFAYALAQTKPGNVLAWTLILQILLVQAFAAVLAFAFAFVLLFAFAQSTDLRFFSLGSFEIDGNSMEFDRTCKSVLVSVSIQDNYAANQILRKPTLRHI